MLVGVADGAAGLQLVKSSPSTLAPRFDLVADQAPAVVESGAPAGACRAVTTNGCGSASAVNEAQYGWPAVSLCAASTAFPLLSTAAQINMVDSVLTIDATAPPAVARSSANGTCDAKRASAFAA